MEYLTYFKIEKEIKKDIPNFSVKEKDESNLQKFLCKILFFLKYSNSFTTFYPTVWRPITKEIDRKHNHVILQHEWVHLKDARTLFGKLKPSRFNVFLFSVLYIFPQCLSILALLTFVNLYFLGFLVFLLPFPAPFRYYAELRAYRRTLELTPNKDKEKRVENIAKSLSGSKYYFCIPFKNLIVKDINKSSSPYKEEMDKAMELDI